MQNSRGSVPVSVNRAENHRDAVPEGKAIGYKREIPGKGASDVVTLLVTVSSFANTEGGDLHLGVKANKGVPTELLGIEINNLDREAANRTTASGRIGAALPPCRHPPHPARAEQMALLQT